MDELRGPSIQIVLHVKEGLGFGFLRTPFIVSGSLNGYVLETDPALPTHAPIFDAELVWEAEKRRFRSLRVQNVPVKVEVFSTGTQGKKDKVGYLLLSLLGAQPCPSNKIVDVKHTWHRLLGVRAEGKCCHPQLLMSLTIEDRLSTPTPRNELRMFHSNEVAYPPLHSTVNTPSGKSMLLTLNEYIAESKRTAVSPELQPRLAVDEGLIQLGAGRRLFLLSLTIAAVEHLDQLLPDSLIENQAAVDCYITYSVFTHTIMTDRVGLSAGSGGGATSAAFNQRTSLRLRGDLRALSRYFAECPHLVARVCAADQDVGICSMDLRKLVPTEDEQQFVRQFCDSERALCIAERAYVLRTSAPAPASASAPAPARPYLDVQIALKYLGPQPDKEKPKNLTARSATQLESSREPPAEPVAGALGCKSGSAANFHHHVGDVAYTSPGPCNTARYTNAAGDAVLQTNEIAEMIKKMCESFALSQERLAARERPRTCDMQVQCGPPPEDTASVVQSARSEPTVDRADVRTQENEDGQITAREVLSRRVIVEDITPREAVRTPRDPIRIETSKSDTCINQNEKDAVKLLISQADRDAIMQRFVDELEDWKEKQQQLFTCQLRRKEEYHLELLAKEWAKKRVELECKLSRGIEQCRALAADLSRATDDFRLRGFRNCEREKKLLEAKKALEAHYTAKYQELREASQKMEDDMRHQLKLKDMRAEEVEQQVVQLEKQLDVLKTNLKNTEKDAESKYSGLTKDQTASLIQELRCLEEKLDSAVQSKAFFKEQWGRAVRELHLLKLRGRQQLLAALRHERRQLADLGLDPIEDQDENIILDDQVDIKKLKDDFYVDLLANTPGLESQSLISNSVPGGMDMFDDLKTAPKNPASEKLSELISQREQLERQPDPDPRQLQRLSADIRSLLLNCGP